MEDMKIRMKNEAIERMKLLGIHENAIREFEEESKLNQSEHLGALYWVEDEEVLQAVKEIESRRGILIYHIIFTPTEVGDLYSFLYASSCTEEWELERGDLRDCSPLAYVYNLSTPYFSEFGSIGIQPINGGIVRTA